MAFQPVVADTPLMQRLALKPVARLKPTVQAALAEIVANLSRDGALIEAEVADEALFVPLAAFQRRGLDTAQVVDALDAAGLLSRVSRW